MMEFELIYTRKAGFQRLPLDPPPPRKAGEVLVRPKWVGICGSDLYLMESYPGELRLGHEWVGIVEETGEIVTSTGTLACFHCEYCQKGQTNLCDCSTHLSSDRLGALRSWMIVSERNLARVPGPMRPALVTHELTAVAEEGMRLLHEATQGRLPRELLILGGGPVGLMFAQIARDACMEPVVVEKHDFRIAAARKRGIGAISLSQALMDEKMAQRFDLLIDATHDYHGGQGAFRQIPIFAKKGFTALIVGKYLSPQSVPTRFNSMGGKLVWMRGMPQRTLLSSIEKWATRIDELAEGFISDVLPIDQAERAFRLSAEQSRCMKVVIEL